MCRGRPQVSPTFSAGAHLQASAPPPYDMEEHNFKSQIAFLMSFLIFS